MKEDVLKIDGKIEKTDIVKNGWCITCETDKEGNVTALFAADDDCPNWLRSDGVVFHMLLPFILKRQYAECAQKLQELSEIDIEN